MGFGLKCGSRNCGHFRSPLGWSSSQDPSGWDLTDNCCFNPSAAKDMGGFLEDCVEPCLIAQNISLWNIKKGDYDAGERHCRDYCHRRDVEISSGRDVALVATVAAVIVGVGVCLVCLIV